MSLKRRRWRGRRLAKAVRSRGAEPLASALSAWGTPERDLRALPKKLRAGLELRRWKTPALLRPRAEAEGRETLTGEPPPPAPAACAEDEEGRAEGTGGHSRSSPRALLGQEEALHPPVARPGDAQTFVTLTHGRRSCERGPEQLLCLGLSNPTAATEALCPNEER